jgi:Arc/MetJ family transcription regulator
MTAVDIDDVMLEQARAILGTKTKKDTINAALTTLCAVARRGGLTGT